MPDAGSEEFSVHQTRTGAGTIVRLSGTIDERFVAAKAFGGVGSTAVFDLKNVRRITSFGVREWIRGLSTLAGTTYFFVNCRPNLIAQFNMVPNFGGSGQVISFFAPYRCPSCNQEYEEPVDLRTQLDTVRQGIAPPRRCPKCSNALEFDDVPEAFFSYFANTAPPQLSDTVSTLVDLALGEGGATTPGASIRVVKQVDGAVTGVWLVGRLDGKTSMKRALADLEGHAVFLLSGLDSCDANGLAPLGQFSVAPNKSVRFWFARVPPAAFGFMAGAPKSLGNASVVSLEVPFVCRNCGAATRDEVAVTDEGTPSLPGQGGTPPRICPSCGSPMGPRLAREDLAALAKVPLGVAPPIVREFLDRHRVAPAALPAAGPVADTDAGTQRFGSYELIRPLGAGGMAEIYLARLVGPEGFVKTLVLKQILPGLAASPEFLQMFLTEARLAAKISHANVVQIFDLGVAKGRYFIAMEYVPGWNLNTILAAGHRNDVRMPINVACRIVADVCAGLSAAHTLVDESGRPLGVVHRDVSPHNVLISPQGAVKLSDFGIAKALDTAERTSPGVVKGKIAYLSPEQVAGEPVDARADIFAAGVLLHECLSGRQLFRRKSDTETFAAIASGLVTPPSALRPDVPAPVEQIVLKALAREPAQRFQKASQMLRAIEEYLASTGRTSTSADVASFVRTLMEGESGDDRSSDALTDSELLANVPTRPLGNRAK